MRLSGDCEANSVTAAIISNVGNTLNLSGTGNSDSTVSAVDITASGAITVPATTNSDFDVIANNTAVGPFARIHLHGAYGSPCTFWRMVAPSN
jgi:hypothetical protein